MGERNVEAQDMLAKLGIVPLLLSQLKSGSFDPKKTACFCLQSVITQKDLNVQECVTLDGTAILCELVSDEQDDELSERAFECL